MATSSSKHRQKQTKTGRDEINSFRFKNLYTDTLQTQPAYKNTTLARKRSKDQHQILYKDTKYITRL